MHRTRNVGGGHRSQLKGAAMRSKGLAVRVVSGIAVLCLASVPAFGALPRTNKRYQGDLTANKEKYGSVTLRIGDSKRKIERASVRVAICNPDADTFTFDNVRIKDDGRFSKEFAPNPEFPIRKLKGRFTSRGKATGSFTEYFCRGDTFQFTVRLQS